MSKAASFATTDNFPRMTSRQPLRPCFSPQSTRLVLSCRRLGVLRPRETSAYTGIHQSKMAGGRIIRVPYGPTAGTYVIFATFVLLFGDQAFSMDAFPCSTSHDSNLLSTVLARTGETGRCARSNVSSYSLVNTSSNAHRRQGCASNIGCHRVFLSANETSSTREHGCNSTSGDCIWIVGLLSGKASGIGTRNKTEKLVEIARVAEEYLHAAESAWKTAVNATFGQPANVTLVVELRDICSGTSYLPDVSQVLSIAGLATGAGSDANFSSTYRSLFSECGTACQAPFLPSNSSVQPTQLSSGRTRRLQIVIGPVHEDITAAISPIWSQFQVPHISLHSANKEQRSLESPYLFRMLGNRPSQVMAMIAALRTYNWTSVYLLAAKGQGTAMQDFRSAFRTLGSGFRIAYEAQFATDDEMKVNEIAQRILTGQISGRKAVYHEPFTVVLFANGPQTVYLLSAIQRFATTRNLTGTSLNRPIVWLVSSPVVGELSDVYQNFSSFVNQTVIEVTPRIGQEFGRYFQRSWPGERGDPLRQANLTVESVKRNPWLGELWQTWHNCSLVLSQEGCSPTMPSECCCATGMSGASIAPDSEPRTQTFERLWLAVHAAVRALAITASNQSALPVQSALVRALKNVEVNCVLGSTSGQCRVFGPSNAPDPTYLLRTVYGSPSLLSNVSAVWTQDMGVRPVCSNDTTCKSFSTAVARTATVSAPKCNQTCAPGHIMVSEIGPVRQQWSSPCWKCTMCPETTIRNPDNAAECVPCEKGWKSNAQRTECISKSVVHRGLHNIIGVFILLASLVGIVAVIYTMVVFYTFNEHDIVQEAGGVAGNLLMWSTLFASYIDATYLLQTPTTFFCVSSSILTASIIIQLKALLIARSCRLLYFGSTKAKVQKFCELFGKSEHRQLLILLFAHLLFGTLPHALLQGLTPHHPVIIDLDRTQAHLVCVEKTLFKFLSSALLVVATALMTFFVLWSFRVKTLRDHSYPCRVFTLKDQAAEDWEEGDDDGHSSGRVRQYALEYATLLASGLSVTALFIALTPTFMVTVRILWPLIIGVSLQAQAAAVWTCLYAPRIIKLHSFLQTQRTRILGKAEARRYLAVADLEMTRIPTNTSVDSTATATVPEILPDAPAEKSAMPNRKQRGKRVTRNSSKHSLLSRLSSHFFGTSGASSDAQ